MYVFVDPNYKEWPYNYTRLIQLSRISKGIHYKKKENSLHNLSSNCRINGCLRFDVGGLNMFSYFYNGAVMMKKMIFFHYYFYVLHHSTYYWMITNIDAINSQNI